MRIRLAMQGYGQRGPATTMDEVTCGIRVPWVELDGQRISKDLISAEFRASDDGPTRTLLTVEILGPVELVYTDAKGVPLDPQASEEIEASDTPELLGVMDHTSVVLRES